MRKSILALVLGVLFAMPYILRAEESKEDINEYLPLMKNSSWTEISYGFEPPVMINICKNTGDTIMGEKTYHIIQKYGMNTGEKTVPPTIIETRYVYENQDERKVYVYSSYDETDILLYDFSLKTGDTLPGDPQYILTEISTVNDYGYSRRQYTFTNTLSDSIVWVEGIGNYTDMLYPNAIKHADISRILCVWQNEDVVYDTGIFHNLTCEDIKNMYKTQALNGTVISAPVATKILQDGQLLILHGDKTYTLEGTEL